MATLDTTQIAPWTFWEDGSIRIGRWRVTLDSVVRELASGSTAEQVEDGLPTLSLREIYGAISFYLKHEDQVEEYLQRRDQEAARVRAEIEDRPRIAALRRRLRERYARLKGR
jgi:uncharacterized protein (DUF433 family)